jgi:hypothetical protein
MVSGCSRYVVQCLKHPLQGNRFIALEYELFQKGPVQVPVGFKAQPLPSSVRRQESTLDPSVTSHAGAAEPDRHAGLAFNRFEGRKRALAGAEIWVSPRRALRGFGKREPQLPDVSDDAVIVTYWVFAFPSHCGISRPLTVSLSGRLHASIRDMSATWRSTLMPRRTLNIAAALSVG